MAATDLFLSLPWLFLLITVRALLPLNVSPLGVGSDHVRTVRMPGLGRSGARDLRRSPRTLQLRIHSDGARIRKQRLQAALAPCRFLI